MKPAELGYPADSVVLVSVHGLGDTHLVAGLAHHVKSRYPSHPLVLLVKSEHQDLARMFPGIDMIGPAPPMRDENELHEPYPGYVYQTHPSVAPIRGDYCVAYRSKLSDASMYAMVLGFPPDVKVELPTLPLDGPAKARSLLTSYLGTNDHARTVLFVPRANSWPNIPTDFYAELATTLELDGRKVIWNNEAWPLSVAFSLLQEVEWVIGANCGFMQVAVCGQFKCKKTVLHQDLKGNTLGLPLASITGWSNVRKIDGRRYAIEEFCVSGRETWTPLINEIAHGYNATAPKVRALPYCSVIDVESGAGDVIDRLTILQIKRDKLPDKAFKLTREVWLLTEIRNRLVDINPNVVLYEVELDRLNRIAWDANQILINEVTDDYGEGDWQIGVYCPHPDKLEKAEKVIKAFAAAHRANRQRVWVKNEIDKLCDTGTREEKSYLT